MDTEVIKKNIVDNLYWDTRVDASNIKVEVDDGKITLKGTVPSYSASMAVADNVWMVSGVKEVENNLEVTYSTEVSVPSDEEIKDNIQKSLFWDTEILADEIEVTVEQGIVTLEGTVDSYWKKQRVEEDADLTGVLSVVNEISVVPTADVVDEDIAEDVTKAIERNSLINVDDITVKVEDGKVTLTGTVSDWRAFTAAENSAFYTLGVIEVDNQLIVS